MFLHKARLAVKHAAELGLTDDQVSKIKALEYTLKKGLIKEKADIKSIGLDIREALGKDVVDTSAINILIDKIYAVKAQIAKEDIQAYANLRTIITKDQCNKLKEMRQRGMSGKMGRCRKGKEGKENASAQGDTE